MIFDERDLIMSRIYIKYITFFAFISMTCMGQFPINMQQIMQNRAISMGQPSKSLEMKGRITMDAYMEKIPQFRVICDGKETTSDSEGFFTMPLDFKELQEFSLIICKDVKHNFDRTNTIKHVSTIPSKDYRYFTFTRMSWGNRWQQQEKKFNKQKQIVPDRSIIVLIDPKSIERIDPWQIDLPENIIKLPIIVLKKDSHAKASAYSILRSLNDTTFHESVKHEVQNVPGNPKVKVSLTQ